MAKDQVKSDTRPRTDVAAGASELRLSDGRAKEVRRRLATPSKETIPAEEIFKRYRSTRT
jgi:hypothetical protein